MTEKLTVGQEVRVVRMRRWKGQLPQVIGSGNVTKVGRRYAFADTTERTYEFDMTTGYERGDSNGNGVRIVTAGQADREQRERDATEFLRERGVEIAPRARLALEQVEAIAAILRPDPESE